MDVEIGLGNASTDELMKDLSIFRVGRGIGHVSNDDIWWEGALVQMVEDAHTNRMWETFHLTRRFSVLRFLFRRKRRRWES
ncbi:hypothetical protein MRB53_018351 [Persea americana]|uniref:Uncharacterized protein n=1 Tax=Persea americana TaxID=3435 RepID=A0ACC2M925_PERAE|nr:hypothetical protein MRB53_018351 [Persea americana]